MVKPISAYEARGIIKKLNRMNLDQIGYGHIKNTIKSLITGLPMKMITPRLDARLYRGVIYKEKPLDVKLLSYPPKELVTNFQRCNPPDSPMFYCSVDPAAICSELRVRSGDKLYLSKWSVAEEFFCARVSPNEDEYENSRENELVFGYFETKFLQPIHQTYSSQYKITAAICECLTTGNIVGDLRTNGGLIYPSVAHSSRSENLAIQPHVVDRCLHLDWVEELTIEAVSDISISYKRTDFSSNFEDGLISWTGKALHWTLAPGKQITMTAELDGWIARDLEGNIVNPG
jgi:hypothetical protein